MFDVNQTTSPKKLSYQLWMRVHCQLWMQYGKQPYVTSVCISLTNEIEHFVTNLLAMFLILWNACSEIVFLLIFKLRNLD